ncbi:unnamed protein product [Enterobius vermicularis]|uniref:Cell cycle control protein n=1 Tax=Enterobius vermicularis TaxID=51028 RepID=A0A0N4UX07_ENTVE|nr:unnamed protein product [Enterobius vermicularis]
MIFFTCKILLVRFALKVPDSRLRQQKLPAWRPIWTITGVLGTTIFVAIVFIPIGIALLYAIRESITEYTNCINSSIGACVMDITLLEPFDGDVYFYYALDNYFQNHRRYVKSRSDKQLLGDLQDVSEYTFTLYFTGRNDRILVPWTHEGVAWEVDKKHKFKNPPGNSLQEAFKNTTKPPNWQKNVWELDPEHPDNNGFLNTDFIVWMRTAALPNFRKLYRRLIRIGFFTSGLPLGRYELRIINNYPVTVFGGRKYFVISTTSWAGGKNLFLGVMYIIVGSLCVIAAIAFTVIHRVLGNRFTS